MDLDERIRILTEGAKYDVSCSSSGSPKTTKRGMVGNTEACGICHSFTADGRCVSLLKMLLSNKCEYDCLYCANRRSADIPRASLEPDEFCSLAMDFYKRNYIEGIFLSSAVEKSPDYTMGRLSETAERLRTVYKYNGYIHLKAIPGADRALIDHASRFSDRMSLNIELPTENSLKLLAPQKKKDSILLPMRMLAGTYAVQQEERPKVKKIPAGQTTQMVIGATDDRDGQIIKLSEALYRNYQLKRVYYSAFSPVGSSERLPMTPPNLRRENRLYQADWLLRFYGFQADELLSTDENLDYDVDPKSGWALRNIHLFPVEINTASYDDILRVPGIGTRNAWRIVEARKSARLSFDSLKKMRVALKRAKHFITVGGKYYGLGVDEPDFIRRAMTVSERETQQLSFSDLQGVSYENNVIAITGQM